MGVLFFQLFKSVREVFGVDIAEGKLFDAVFGEGVGCVAADA
jgi:hypothetical protein